MRIKKANIKPYIYILIGIIAVLVITLIVTIIICSRPEQEEPIEEEIVIEYEPYTNYDWNKLSIDDNGYYSYEDDKYTSLFGIDVSAHQGTIDWQKVKAAGVDFAFIRIGYRGAIEAILHEDEEFQNNYQGTIENGIITGIYWYSQPVNEQEAIEEADYVLELLGDRHLDLPIVYDLEETEFYDGSISRLHNLSRDDYTKMAVAFCKEIQKNHHDVMIYTNYYWANNNYNWEELEGIPVWFAQYASEPLFKGPFVIWQYADYGHVDGIKTDADLDMMLIQKNGQN